MIRPVRWTLLVAAAVLCCFVLRLHQNNAAPPGLVKQPFANSLEQRRDMVNELREIRSLLEAQNALLKEQNDLLRAAADRAERADAKNQGQTSGRGVPAPS